MTAVLRIKYGKLFTALLLLAIVWIVIYPVYISAFAGFGGYISEKLLGNGTDESLYLGDGINDLTVLGTGPVISTLGATSSSSGGVVSMVVKGNLQNLNGMPRADVWFVWGYSAATMNNTTAINTVTTTGVQTVTINPNAGTTVYYQFRSSTDSTVVGAVRSLTAVGGGHGVSYWLLQTLLPIIVAAVILVGVLILTRNPLAAFGAGVIGLVGYYLVQAVVNIF